MLDDVNTTEAGVACDEVILVVAVDGEEICVTRVLGFAVTATAAMVVGFKSRLTPTPMMAPPVMVVGRMLALRPMPARKILKQIRSTQPKRSFVMEVARVAAREIIARVMITGIIVTGVMMTGGMVTGVMVTWVSVTGGMVTGIVETGLAITGVMITSV